MTVQLAGKGCLNSTGGLQRGRCSRMLLSVLVLAFLGCGRDAELLKETSREPNATLRFANFRRTQYSGTGALKWDLRAEEAFIYQINDTVDRIVVYGFELNQPDATDPLLISADRGELNHQTGSLTVEGNIRLKDKDGTIESQRLHYDTEKKIASSDDPVTVNRKGLHTVCQGGIYFERLKDRLICRSPQGTVESLPSDNNRPLQPAAEDIFQ